MHTKTINMTTSKFNEITFTDADVVNPDDFIPSATSTHRSYNPHSVKPFLLHDHGFTLAVVFADCLQDAIDIACDAGKLVCYEITDADLERDYPTDADQERLSFLGNYGRPHDIETLGAVELPNPSFSFCALFNASRND